MQVFKNFNIRIYNVRFLFFILFILQVNIFVSAQQNSSIAVLPFTAVEVSENEAKVLTTLFETALVKTGSYNVIERNQLDDILKAQAFSLSGCTDDACAIEVGKLVSAEMIVLGEISRVGTRYIATAKIIDVSLGKNVNADSVTAEDIVLMTDEAIGLLAYKLAGLTYTTGGEAHIATSFGEVFIKTDPKGAEIFVNGISRGTSPLVADEVPLGTVRITAKKDNYFGEAIAELDSQDILEIDIPLELTLGRLFIKYPEESAQVFLDDSFIGFVREGLFKDLLAGEHIVEIKGNWNFWKGDVSIEKDKTVTLKASPIPYGTLYYIVEAGASGVIKDLDDREIEIAGNSEINLPPGEYEVKVAGTDFVSLQQKIIIKQGVTTYFTPRLSFSEEYLEKQAAKERAMVRSELDGEIKGFAYRLNAFDGTTNSRKYLDDGRNILRNVESYHSFPDLENDMKALIVKTIDRRIGKLEALVVTAKKKESDRVISKILFYGTGLAGLVLTGVSWYLGEEEYGIYENTTITSEALASRDRLELYSTGKIVGVSLAGLGTLIGLTVPGQDSALKTLNAEIASLAAERAAIKEGL